MKNIVKKVQDCKETILENIKVVEWVSFGDLMKRIKWATSKDDVYYKAWQELKIEGRLQIGVSGLWMVNQ